MKNQKTFIEIEKAVLEYENARLSAPRIPSFLNYKNWTNFPTFVLGMGMLAMAIKFIVSTLIVLL